MQKKADRLEILAAAYLYGQQQTEEAIGRSLGLSQSVVSRLIKIARREGILQTKTTFIKELGEDELARILARVRPVELQESLSRVSVKGSKLPGPVLHVYPSHSRNTSVAAWRHRIDEFANACAKDLLEVLAPASLIGVSWGNTLASAIAAMEKTVPARRATQQRARMAIPLIGEPLGLNISQHSSSVLAARLGEALNPDAEPGKTHSLSLAPVPALIPADMTESEIAAIRKLIGRITAYRAIFGPDGRAPSEGHENAPLIRRIDAVLTSTSTHEWPLGFDDDSLIRTAGVPREQLNDLVIGDLCGAVIPRPNLDGKAKAEVESILRRWTGVKISQLRDCALRSQTGGPGVIVLAIGANKAQVVFEAVRRGLVQHLFTDQDLADELEEHCSATFRTA
jgi:DNA-binding transcriptional regulator LsrR (DeoR family)